MNANELADWIKDTEFYVMPPPNINYKMDEVEAMLRQQQAEIDRLNKLAEAISRDCNNTALERNELQAEIEALEAHPAKELTDEEIEKVFYDTHFGFKGRDDSDFVDFARAILRKAQEK